MYRIKTFRTFLAVIFVATIVPTISLYSCGFALVYLRKPISYYQQRYANPLWGLEKLGLVMEKQRNRGHDGAGIAVIKTDMPVGAPYLQRIRTIEENSLEDLFARTLADITVDAVTLNTLDELTLKTKFKFIGHAYLGHLRYGTHSGIDIDFCQPFVLRNICAAKSFVLAGNFNLTNTTELLEHLTSCGLNPIRTIDTQIIVDMLSYHLNQYDQIDTPEDIIPDLLNEASHYWDGGYILAGILGTGDAFVCRDPAGIRSGFFYSDEEVIAVASERTALINSFNASPQDIKPIEPGHVLIINHVTKQITQKRFTEDLPLRQCVFERIYFSRGSDPAIYQERKNLGKNLAHRVLQALDNNLEHVLFSYIPNTSEPALLGLVQEIELLCAQQQQEDLIHKLNHGTLQRQDLETIYPFIRKEKIVHKDQLMRTFIANDIVRSHLVSHIYDVTKGIIGPQDTLVVIDDSIVRGTTLRESIIKQLINLNPAHIIFISSAPPILYPDCYGIDMSQLGKFIAFQAAVELLQERHEETLLDWIAQQYEQETDPINYVQELYKKVSLQELEEKVAHMIRPADSTWRGTITVIYQSVDGLHDAIPDYTGDWYFTGNYPTLGGYKVLKNSYLNWYYGDTSSRAY